MDGTAGPGRRGVLGGLAAAGLGVGLAGCGAPSRGRAGAAVGTAPLAAAGRTPLLLQILAHPDDDLYFMNPDTQHTLDSGVPLVSVYVTGGEANGDNRVVSDSGPHVYDKAAYSSARHQGLRQAYATLLGLDKYTPWQKSVAELRGGHRAEVNRLQHRGRSVELVFLNTAMHTPLGGRMGLPSLWEDHHLQLPVVIAEGSPLTRAKAYTYDSMVDVLEGLLADHSPTLVQTLDPDPDIQHSSPADRSHDSEQPGYSDHADHTAAASFAWAAMIRHAERGNAFLATAYRAYYNRHWPKNLPAGVLAEKAAHLVPYGGDKDWQCGNPGGCGDYNVGGKRPLTNWKGWVRSTHHRHPGPRLLVSDDGAHAYGVLGLRAVRWSRSADDRWGGPQDLGGSPLAPVLGGATLPDGRQLLCALRFSSLQGRSGANTREVVLLEQAAPGGEFTAWQGLGNPERGDDRGRRIGPPTAVAAPDGRVHLFVRNADRGVSTRVRGADGTWSPWRDLGGDSVQEGLSAAVDGRGRVHVFAAGADTVHHWTQSAPGRPLAPVPSRLPLAVDAVAPVPLGDGGSGGIGGGVQLLYRTSADPKKAREDPGSPASPHLTSVHLDGTPAPPVALDGYGPVAAAGGHVLGTDERGRVQLARAGRVSKRSRGVVPAGPPTLYVHDGQPVALGLGVDAAPWSWRP
ncbi:PIG-L family deacetylase [Streptomyces sp. NBC_00083]|uniref:PIG-L family deacetylase n=1 Tax=Streptomyces sp. NBC_00083 TaxID=2975647 RepID=UPI00224DC543|nr:PIG-L family deacetylase [Streptomyces sp. NBC_00083]MCX5385035.1 PIG-L family deacetylase [Streptomyces sp. NBC_00083]